MRRPAQWLLGLGFLVAVIVFITLAAVDASTVGAREWVQTTSVLSLAVGFGAIGLLLTVKRPENAIGWLLLGFGTAFTAKLAAEQLAIASHEAERGVAAAWSLFVNTALDPVWLLLLLTAGVLFPHGRVPGRRWRRGLGLCYVAFTLMLPLALFASYTTNDGITIPAPVSGFESADDFVFLLSLPIFFFSIAALARLVVLAFRGNPVERGQIRWVGFSVFVILAFLAIDLFIPGANLVAGVVAGVGLPIAIGIAITRYRLYDIDRLISRTLAYGIVIGAFAIGFAFIVAFPTLVLGASSSETVPDWLIAASTLAVFLLFNPFRKRVQGAVDRRFNRLPYDPAQLTDSLGKEVSNIVNASDLEAIWLSTAVQSLQPSTAAVWTRDSL